MESNENPLVPRFERAGAAIGSPLGVSTALHFGDAAGEHRALRAGAGVIDLPHLGSISVGGADRVEFLHRMVTSDVRALTAGDSQFSAFLSTRGKFVAVFDLIARENGFLLIVPHADLGTLLSDLTKYAILDDVVFADESSVHRSLHIAGPDCDGAIELVRTGGGCTIVPHDRTGGAGFDVHGAPGDIETLWGALTDAGVTPVGHEAHETLRIEAGIPRAGAELTGDIGPLEAGMPELVSLTKGCYRGQEVVAKMHYLGKPPKRIVGLGIMSATAMPAPGDPIASDGKSVGRITSAARVPSLERYVALGLVRTKAIEGSAPITCRTADGTVEMRFEETPFR